MTKRLVDIDDTELRIAQAVGGYSTMKETVSAGLRELAAAEARRREILRLTSGSMAEFVDKSFRADAWR
ncbi:MAG TPA: type II toxin-antitoxin system VapB family antitoxin [Galbitalea sp.]